MGAALEKLGQSSSSSTTSTKNVALSTFEQMFHNDLIVKKVDLGRSLTDITCLVFQEEHVLILDWSRMTGQSSLFGECRITRGVGSSFRLVPTETETKGDIIPCPFELYPIDSVASPCAIKLLKNYQVSKVKQNLFCMDHQCFKIMLASSWSYAPGTPTTTTTTVDKTRYNVATLSKFFHCGAFIIIDDELKISRKTVGDPDPRKVVLSSDSTKMILFSEKTDRTTLTLSKINSGLEAFNSPDMAITLWQGDINDRHKCTDYVHSNQSPFYHQHIEKMNIQQTKEKSRSLDLNHDNENWLTCIEDYATWPLSRLDTVHVYSGRDKLKISFDWLKKQAQTEELVYSLDLDESNNRIILTPPERSGGKTIHLVPNASADLPFLILFFRAAKTTHTCIEYGIPVAWTLFDKPQRMSIDTWYTKFLAGGGYQQQPKKKLLPTDTLVFGAHGTDNCCSIGLFFGKQVNLSSLHRFVPLVGIPGVDGALIVINNGKNEKKRARDSDDDSDSDSEKGKEEETIVPSKEGVQACLVHFKKSCQ